MIIESTTPGNYVSHPIEFLIKRASDLHEDWVKRAGNSKTLAEAVTEYRRRYKRAPPPGFDKWFDYAKAKDSKVIDEFDIIYDDILPFWAVSPKELRQLTREVLADEWNEIAELSIRSGKAELSSKVLPTHRWMMEGAQHMLENFVQWLPDMDLAFNINDESRVAVPYERMLQYRKIGRKGGIQNGDTSRTAYPKQEWPPTNMTAPLESRFKERSLRRSFHDFAAASCPPSSPARRYNLWNPATLCTWCYKPHSLGSFVKEWTLAASPCHQPDLANLHGFFLSPAAFKVSTDLVPVFSQSKVSGFSDIRYPSPWNYMDKIKYEPTAPSSPDDPQSTPTNLDPPFSEKSNVLFWRGATSEGVSNYGTWRGMTRQRLVHLFNNHTSPLPVLLADRQDSPATAFRASYKFLHPTTALASDPQLAPHNLSTSIHVVGGVQRCRGIDCYEQEQEFAWVEPTPFNAHWQHRFLMDVDGAGFSGRFLPFLQSKSLPFKAALFREWYDTRLTAWKHFVPVDLRLHGLWSTLAYFGADAGTPKSGAQNESEVNWGLKQAEEIANAGREWAGQVLRKEDMEIYFFRLLLEWGRLTNDKRDELGLFM